MYLSRLRIHMCIHTPTHEYIYAECGLTGEDIVDFIFGGLQDDAEQEHGGFEALIRRVDGVIGLL